MLTAANVAVILSGMGRASTGVARGSFEELVGAWLYTHRSVNTQAAYERDLQAFAAWWHTAHRRSPLTASSADLAAFQEACVDGGASSASVQRRMSAVSSFFQWTIESGSARTNPMDGVVRNGVVRDGGHGPTGLPIDEVRHLFEATALADPKVAVLVGLLLHDGLRLSEALGLDVPDVIHRPEAPEPLQPAAPRPRSAGGAPDDPRLLAARIARRGRAQVVDLDERTGAALRRYLGRRDAGPLLLGDSPTTDRGRRLTRFGADYLLKRVGRAAGLAHPLTAGTLRATYAATARAAGVAVDDIRHHLGHRDERSTRRFLGGPDDHLP